MVKYPASRHTHRNTGDMATPSKMSTHTAAVTSTATSSAGMPALCAIQRVSSTRHAANASTHAPIRKIPVMAIISKRFGG